jgi:hypothetical protein
MLLHEQGRSKDEALTEPGCCSCAQVVLPEGSAFVKASLPFPVEEALERKFTYLDTLGRPVVVLHKADVVPDHNVPLALTYRFSSVYLLQVGGGGGGPCACCACACSVPNLAPDDHVFVGLQVCACRHAAVLAWSTLGPVLSYWVMPGA